jgi:hypothetical protein
VAPKCGSGNRRSPFYIPRRYAECAPRGTRGYLPAAWQRRASTRPAGIGQRPYEADGGEGGDAGRHPARGFEAGSRREVEGEGAAVRVEGLVDRATPLSLRGIRMQRIRERTCEVRLSAPGSQEADVGSAWAPCWRACCHPCRRVSVLRRRTLWACRSPPPKEEG